MRLALSPGAGQPARNTGMAPRRPRAPFRRRPPALPEEGSLRTRPVPGRTRRRPAQAVELFNHPGSRGCPPSACPPMPAMPLRKSAMASDSRIRRPHPYSSRLSRPHGPNSSPAGPRSSASGHGQKISCCKFRGLRLKRFPSLSVEFSRHFGPKRSTDDLPAAPALLGPGTILIESNRLQRKRPPCSALNVCARRGPGFCPAGPTPSAPSLSTAGRHEASCRLREGGPGLPVPRAPAMAAARLPRPGRGRRRARAVPTGRSADSPAGFPLPSTADGSCHGTAGTGKRAQACRQPYGRTPRRAMDVPGFA